MGLFRFPSKDTKRNHFDRESILKRDGYKCSDCGSTKNLEIHHIDGDRSNNNSDNAKTVCQDCHRQYTAAQIRQDSLAKEADYRAYVDKIHQQDAETEKAIRQAWIDRGGSAKDFGGPEYHDFVSSYFKRRG